MQFTEAPESINTFTDLPSIKISTLLEAQFDAWKTWPTLVISSLSLIFLAYYSLSPTQFAFAVLLTNTCSQNDFSSDILNKLHFATLNNETKNDLHIHSEIKINFGLLSDLGCVRG